MLFFLIFKYKLLSPLRFLLLILNMYYSSILEMITWG